MAKYITIFEIDAPLDRDIFINHEPGIWVANLTPGLGLFVDDQGLSSFYGDRNNQRKKVESVRVDGTDYAEQVSIADLRTQTEGFYWDEANQYLYIQFTDSDPPALFERIRVGSAFGYSHGHDTETDNTYSDIYYPPRIKSIPSFSKNRDSLFFGILSYGGGTVNLSNEDGALDNFASLDLYGQPGRIYQIEEGGTLDESSQLSEGIVGTVTHDYDTLSIKLRDRRDSFSKAIPTTAISNFDDDDDGQVKPLAWGPVRKAPAYRTAASTWVFCDTTYNSVINDATFQVYEDGTAVSHGGTVTDGTFTYTATDPRLVTVDFKVGSTFSTGLDILKDIFNDYLNITYNSSNYNTVAWTAAEALAKESAVYLNETTSIRDVIEQISTDNQGILDIQDDGRITFKIFDSAQTPAKIIQHFEDDEQYSELEPNSLSITYDVTEFLSSAQVGYDKNQDAGRYRLVIDTDSQTEVISRYNESRNKRFNTGLVLQADAEALAASIMDRSKEIVANLEFTTFRQNFDLEIMDFIIFNLKRISDTSTSLGVYEILGYNRDILGQRVTIRCKLLPGVDPEQQISNTRITEGDDTRITESGSIRITEGV